MNFSVLLSVYVRERAIYLQQSIESIYTQSLLPNEIVLVKDGPLTNELDDTISRLEKNSCVPFKIVTLEKNVGLGNALGVGLKHCSYDVVARMDSDDIAKPYRFQRQIEVLEQHPDVDVVGAWVDEFIGQPSNVVSVRKLPEVQRDILLFAKRRNPMNHPVVMFRKHSVEAVGGYKHFPLFEDYYLWVRMLVSGYTFYNIQESLLLFRTSNDVYKRRGGFQYAVDECRLRNHMRKLHFISYNDFLLEMPLRFLARIIPAWVRRFFYIWWLRK